MHEDFQLPVTFNNQEYLFPARMHQYGFTVKLEVEIEGQPVFFEPDEERNWRAVLPYGESTPSKPPNPALLQAVAAVIAGLTK